MSKTERILTAPLRVTASEVFLQQYFYRLEKSERDQAFELLENVKRQAYFDGKDVARTECEISHGVLHE